MTTQSKTPAEPTTPARQYERREDMSPEKQAQYAQWDLYHQTRYANSDIVSFADPDNPVILNPRDPHG